MKTKLLLGITGLLFICAHFKIEAKANETSLEGYMWSINLHRKYWNWGKGLSEPVDLIWSEDLVTKAKGVTGSCDERKGGPNHLVFMHIGDDDAKLESYREKQLNEMLASTSDTDERLKILHDHLAHSLSRLEHQVFNPAQKFIGCAANPCTGQVSPEVAEKAGMATNTYSFKELCLLGPAGEFPKAVVQAYLELLDEQRIEKEQRNSNRPNTVTPKSANGPDKEPEKESKTPEAKITELKTSAPQAEAQKSVQTASSASVSALQLTFLIVSIINFFL